MAKHKCRKVLAPAQPPSPPSPRARGEVKGQSSAARIVCAGAGYARSPFPRRACGRAVSAGPRSGPGNDAERGISPSPPPPCSAVTAGDCCQPPMLAAARLDCCVSTSPAPGCMSAQRHRGRPPAIETPPRMSRSLSLGAKGAARWLIRATNELLRMDFALTRISSRRASLICCVDHISALLI